MKMELDRTQRIQANRKKLEELKVQAAAKDLASDRAGDAGEQAPKPKPRKSKKEESAAATLARKSAREKNANVTYKEEEFFRELNELHLGAGGSGGPRGPKRTVDEAELDELRRTCGVAADEAAVAAAEGAPGKKKKNRGNVDSGKGVRIQGGRVYDSKFGLTCHWCRQKTLEEHVTCTNAKCAVGRLPTTFCKMCLRNRHGEDAVAAAASGRWQCPKCRGTCGKGCVSCCNCGPCRKKLELEPTGQVIKLAKNAGFTNVHDYLVHIVTGETPDEITARKLGFPWGSWLGEDHDTANAHQPTAEDIAIQDAEKLAEEALACAELGDTDVPAATADLTGAAAGGKKAKAAGKKKTTTASANDAGDAEPAKAVKKTKKKCAVNSDQQGTSEEPPQAAAQAAAPDAKPTKVTKLTGKRKADDAAAAATDTAAAAEPRATKQEAAAAVADDDARKVQVEKDIAVPVTKKRKVTKASKSDAATAKDDAATTKDDAATAKDDAATAAKASQGEVNQEAQEQDSIALALVDVNIPAVGTNKAVAGKWEGVGKAAVNKAATNKIATKKRGRQGMDGQGQVENKENMHVPAAQRFAQRRQLAASMTKQAAWEGLVMQADNTASDVLPAKDAGNAAASCAAADAPVGLVAAPQLDVLANLNLSRKQRKQLELGLVSLEVLQAQLAQQVPAA